MWLPDRVVNLALQYVTTAVGKSSTYKALKPELDIIMFEIVFPLLCFNHEDAELWRDDPHDYVRKGARCSHRSPTLATPLRPQASPASSPELLTRTESKSGTHLGSECVAGKQRLQGWLTIAAESHLLGLVIVDVEARVHHTV